MTYHSALLRPSMKGSVALRRPRRTKAKASEAAAPAVPPLPLLPPTIEADSPAAPQPSSVS